MPMPSILWQALFPAPKTKAPGPTISSRCDPASQKAPDLPHSGNEEATWALVGDITVHSAAYESTSRPVMAAATPI
ncbi:hypothetical protein CTA1_12629 [Colletotrichum tanaceti]|uniref:Uncharacterized protein n=1 Tax=Colletotrichum tanaceti TaxID=1306861 RepID=A0A4V6DHJ2_9PEZI|nr:hypothetical protein CTA1_12629 [Colletotrichum tanaceti]